MDVRQMEDLLEEAAEWLERKTGHEVAPPEVLLDEVADWIGGAWDRESRSASVRVEDAYQFWVPVHKMGSAEYVTVYDIGAGLCVCLLADDPAKNETLGGALQDRIMALRRAVQKGRAV